MHNSRDTLEQELRHQEKLEAALQNVARLLVDSETGVRGWMLSGQIEFLEPYQKAQQALPDANRALEQVMMADPAMRAYWPKIAGSKEKRLRLLARLKNQTGLDISMLRDGKRAMDEFRGLVDEIREARSQIENSRLSKLQQEHQTARLLVVLAFAFGLVGACGAVWFFSREISRRVRQLHAELDGLAAGAVIETTRAPDDELGDLTRAVQRASGLLAAQRRATEEARQAADAANRAKSDFLARMSHEIRTPMNAILGTADLLWESNLAGTQREYVRVFRSSGQRLLNLINDILDLSRIEAGKVALRRDPFHLVNWLERTVELMRPLANRKGLALDFVVEPEARITLLGDADRLQQVLLNLLSNSVKFTERGSVSVHVSKEGTPPEGIELLFSIADTGAGIAQADLERVFEAFQQGDNSITRRFDGTGLGLAISRSLVDLMRGKIWVNSQPGQGTTFFFTAKFGAGAAIPEAFTFEPEPAPPKIDLAPCRVLIAEDSPDNAFLLKAYLLDQPVEPTIAANGSEAVERFQKEHFDLVLMDLQMPGMDGLSATRAIRHWEQSHRRKRTPIVMLTADAGEEKAKSSIEAGCDGHLTKPVTHAVLLTVIARHTTSRNWKRPRRAPLKTIEEMRPAYLEERRNDVLRLRDALLAEDWEEASRIGHAMIGSGSVAGYPVLTDLGRRIERAAKQKDRGELEHGAEELKQELQGLKA